MRVFLSLIVGASLSVLACDFGIENPNQSYDGEPRTTFPEVTVPILSSVEPPQPCDGSAPVPAFDNTLCPLSGAQVGQDYDVFLYVQGGCDPLTWRLADGSGALPAGLELLPSGRISGTPTANGSFSFTLEVEDELGQIASQSCDLPVSNGPPISITSNCANLSPQIVGEAFNFDLTASGGGGTYTWELLSGTVPAGTTFTPAGNLAGTLSAAGTYVWSVRVSDPAETDNRASTTCSIRVEDPMSIVTAPGQLGVAVETDPYVGQAVVANGGTTPYIWSFEVTSGTFPTGLDFNTSSAVISGTPALNTEGIVTYSLTVQSSLNEANQITVAGFSLKAQDHVEFLPSNPSSPPRGVEGQAYTGLDLNVEGGEDCPTCYAFSLASGSLPSGLTLNATTGEITGNLAAAPGSRGVYTLTARACDTSNPVNCRVSDAFTLEIDSPITIDLASLTLGPALDRHPFTANVDDDLTITGGRPDGTTAVYSWSLASGAPFNGMLFESDGDLLGTPNNIITTTGDTTSVMFTVRVTATTPNNPLNTDTADITLELEDDYVDWEILSFELDPGSTNRQGRYLRPNLLSIQNQGTIGANNSNSGTPSSLRIGFYVDDLATGSACGALNLPNPGGTPTGGVTQNFFVDVPSSMLPGPGDQADLHLQPTLFAGFNRLRIPLAYGVGDAALYGAVLDSNGQFTEPAGELADNVGSAICEIIDPVAAVVGDPGSNTTCADAAIVAEKDTFLGTLATGAQSDYIRFSAGSTGLYAIQVTPDAGVDVAFEVFSNTTCTTTLVTTVNAGGAGVTESATFTNSTGLQEYRVRIFSPTATAGDYEYAALPN